MRALVKRLGCATEPEKMPMGTLGEVHLLAIPHSVGHQFILRKFSTRQAVPKNIFRHEAQPMEPLLPLDEDHQSYSGWVGGHLD